MNILEERMSAGDKAALAFIIIAGLALAGHAWATRPCRYRPGDLVQFKGSSARGAVMYVVETTRRPPHRVTVGPAIGLDFVEELDDSLRLAILGQVRRRGVATFDAAQLQALSREGFEWFRGPSRPRSKS